MTSSDPRVRRYVERQVTAVREGCARLSSDDRTAVHPTRVGTRRLRSTLRTFAPAFRTGQSHGLSTDLRWFAAILGEVRDREVLATTYAGLLSADQASLSGLLTARLREEEDHAWRVVLDELRGGQVVALHRRLDELAIHDPDADTVARCSPASLARFRRRLAAAVAAWADDDLWHDARKAAKRARYAAEAETGPVPEDGRRPERVLVFEELQDLLGEFQDLVVAEDYLAPVAAQVPRLADEVAEAQAESRRRRRELAAAAVAKAAELDDAQ